MAQPEHFQTPSGGIWVTRKIRLLFNAAIAICTLLIIILLPVAMFHLNKDADFQADDEQGKASICGTPTCLNEAHQILQQVNPETNPCDDFYEFACGNMWRRSEEKWDLISGQQEEIDKQVLELYNEPINYEDHTMLQKAKKLYHACLKETGDKQAVYMTLKKALSIAGKWPMVEGSNWNEREFNWLEKTYKFRELGFSHSVFLGVSIIVNPEKKSEYIFKVSLPTISLIEKEIMVQIAQMLGFDQDYIWFDIDQVYRFKEELLSKEESVDNFDQGIIFNVFEYQYKQTHKNITVNWLRFINTILSPAAHIVMENFVMFPPAEMVSHRLNTLLSADYRRAQANYMMWKLIEELASDMILDLQHKRNGVERVVTREKECVDLLRKRYVPNPIDIIYVKRYMPVTKMKVLDKLAANVKEEISELLNKAEWLEAEDKENAINTANEMTIVMGASMSYHQDKIFDDLHVDMKGTSTDHYVELIVQMNKNYQTFWYKQIHKPVVDWKLNLADTRPQYYENNIMVIPAAVLQGVMFIENRPNSLNYGHLGTYVGECEFHFLTIGKEESYANHKWSNITKKALQNNVNCLLKHGMMNISDRGGFLKFHLLRYNISPKASYLGYRKWKNTTGDDGRLATLDYTSNQLYWISSVSNFCERSPSAGEMWLKELQFRSFGFSTIGHNNLNFAEDFSCAVGSQMNSVDKCSLFN